MRERLLAWVGRCLPPDIAQAAIGDLEEEWRRHRAVSRRRAVFRLAREIGVMLWCAWQSPRDARVAAPGKRGGMMNEFWRDLGYGARLALRSPRSTLLSAITLALGLGAATALFSLTNAWLLRPLPFRDAERLVSVWETIPSQSVFENNPAPAVLIGWRARVREFESMAAARLTSVNLTGSGDAERLDALAIEPELVDVLGVRVAPGRALAPAGTGGEAPEVLLTDAFWRRRFNGAGDVIGATLTLDGQPAVVVGIVPREVTLLNFAVDVWVPLRFTEAERGSLNRNLWVFGRVRPGRTIAQASNEIDALARSASNGDLGARAVGLQEQTVGALGHDLPILFGATAVLLLIACANVASFNLARAASRRHEFVVRAALGAGRLRIARQVMTEALPVALVGGAGGLLFCAWLVRAFQSALPQGDTLATVKLTDPRVYAFGFTASLLTAVLFSVGPALLMTSRRTFDGMRSGRGIAGRQRALRILAGAEVALAVALLIAAGLVAQSFVRLNRVDLGFRPGSALTFELRRANPAPDREGSPFVDDLLRRLRETPGIAHAGMTQALPLKAFGFGSNFPVEGSSGLGANILGYWRTITPGYFEALGIPLRAGRAFDARDLTGSERVAIVSESYARRAFPAGTSAIGRRIGWATLERPMTIVGVAADIRLGPTLDPAPHVYMPYTQVAGFLPTDLAVRLDTGTTAAQTVEAVRAAVRAVDPLQPVAKIRTMDELLWRLLGRRRFQFALWSGFAAAAAVLALLGVYGVISFMVRQASKEIGIRLALGAAPQHVHWSVVRQGAGIAVAGAAIGVVIAYWTANIIRGFLINVDARDPLVYAAVVASMLFAGCAASALPARRATRIDPVATLRAQ